MTAMGVLAVVLVGVASGIVLGVVVAVIGIWLAGIISKRNGWN
jgi:hypothetical protein